MTNKLLRALFAAPEAWCFDVVETDAAPTPAAPPTGRNATGRP
jgi:hypothetical protein